MNSLFTKVFGKSRDQEDRETIVKLIEEKHELDKALRASEELRMRIAYEAVELIEKRSPEDSMYFWNKWVNR